VRTAQEALLVVLSWEKSQVAKQHQQHT